MILIRRKGLFQKIAVNAVLVVASLAIPLLLFEAGLRLFAPQRDLSEGLYVMNETLGHIYASDWQGEIRAGEFLSSLRINSLGLRENEYGPKTENTFRIFVIGDSFTAGLQVPSDKTWVKRLEELLNEQDFNTGCPNYEVLNGGVNGYGFAQEYLLLNTVGLTYNPDLILVGFVDVDILRNSKYLEHLEIPGIQPEEYQPDGQGATSRMSVLRSIVTFLRDNTQTFEFVAIRATRIDLLNELGFNLGLRNRAGLDIYNRTRSQGRMTKFENSKTILEAVGRSAKANGATMAIALLPTDRWVHFFLDQNEGNLDLNWVRNGLTTWSEASAIPFIDISEGMALGGGTALYYPRDRHPNESGHRMAGDLIFQGLKSHNLIQCPASK